MKFGSVCSGIEAASVAWAPLGWRAAWLAEIEPFPSAVLAHHYPDTPNLGDMTRIARLVLQGDVEAPDVLAGGTPCQAFSVAGLRESLADARGNLTLKFVELADAIDLVRGRAGKPASIVIWENVPGVLSTKDNAFGCFLAGLAGEDEPLQPPGQRWENAGAVYGPQRAIAWRTLDAQYFGLAQRRRRVFVVASARDGFDPAQVLFEWDGVRRDSAPRRGEGAGASVGTLGGTSPGGGWRFGADEAAAGQLIPFDTTQLTSAENRCRPEAGDPCHPLAAGAHPPAIALQDVRGLDKAQNGRGWSDEGCAYTLDAAATQGVAYTTKLHNTGSNNAGKLFEERTTCLDANSPPPALLTSAQVRRLIPVECERLQGFPDDYTLIPWRKRPVEECPDGPRYKAIGNSWAVPVARWVGWRVAAHLAANYAEQSVQRRAA